MKIYIIGSLRNKAIPEFANTLRDAGFDAFADWFAPGPDADDFWRDYSKARGWNYKQALQSYAAKHVFEFDKQHLDESDVVVMLMPAGKSGHLELGYAVGKGKPAYILFDGEPERYDVMVQFTTDIFFNQDDLIAALKNLKPIDERVGILGKPLDSTNWPWWEAGITDLQTGEPRWTGLKVKAASKEIAEDAFGYHGFYRNLTVRRVDPDENNRTVSDFDTPA